MSEFHGIRLSLGDAADVLAALKELQELLSNSTNDKDWKEQNPDLFRLYRSISAEYNSAL